MSFLKKKAFSSRVTASRTTSGRPPNKERQDAASLIGEETDCGRDIIRFMANTMAGKLEECTPAVRLAAATWLGNYFFGKPVETTVQLSMARTQDTLPGLTDEQLEDILRGGIPSQLLGRDTQDARRTVGPDAALEDGNMEVPEVRIEDVRHGPATEVPGASPLPESKDVSVQRDEVHGDDT